MTKYVIKVAEARAIIAMGDALDAPAVRQNREGNLVYYTADQDEMARWRSARAQSETASEQKP